MVDDDGVNARDDPTSPDDGDRVDGDGFDIKFFDDDATTSDDGERADSKCFDDESKFRDDDGDGVFIDVDPRSEKRDGTANAKT